jgi:AmiR/NasT family two-component response regulator
MPESQDPSPAAPARHLWAGLDSRAVVEQAKGIIMAERRCTAPEASAILAKAAEHSGRGAVDLAAALVESAVHQPRKVR